MAIASCRVGFAATWVLALAGCATTAPVPASSQSVNRFYRDMAECFERARPDAVRKSTFTRYVPQARTNLIRETVSFTVDPKTVSEYRVVFAETAPDTTSVTSVAVGRNVSAAQVRDATQPLVDGCAARPF